MKKLSVNIEYPSKLDIDERMHKILYSIVDSYIHTGDPIGSRTLSKLLDIQLSPATIRNTMIDLADLGYLMQLHLLILL